MPCFALCVPGQAHLFAGKECSARKVSPPIDLKSLSLAQHSVPRRGNRLLLTGLNSNLRFGDRIKPKSCCSGFPYEEGVPLFPESWCCESSKADSSESNSRPPFQAEIRS